MRYQLYIASHLPFVIFWCIYCCFDPFYSSFSDCNFDQKLFIISLCIVYSDVIVLYNNYHP